MSSPLFTPYSFKPVEVEAIQFDGKHCTGQLIIEKFPDQKIELVYDYGQYRYKLLVYNNGRYELVQSTDYVVRGPQGRLLIYSGILFEQLFQKIFVEP